MNPIFISFLFLHSMYDLQQVSTYTVDGMQLLREFDMPSPMTFKEEGGVSLSPDGKKFIAVRGVALVCYVCYCNFALKVRESSVCHSLKNDADQPRGALEQHFLLV